MSHGNGRRCGVSLFEPVDALDSKLPINFRASFMAHSHTTIESSRYSLWESLRYGCSSTSSPEIASPSSSTNSHSYGQSPDDSISVGSLINNLLQVVNFDDNGSSCDIKQTSKYHNSSTVDQYMSGRYSSSDVSRPTMINLSSPSPPMAVSIHCDLHGESQNISCRTCNKTLCSECNVNHHCGGTSLLSMEAIKDAEIQAKHVMNEAKIGIAALKDDLDAVQVAAESLEQKARQAMTDVMVCMRRMVSAVETRQKELLARVEKARLAKYAALKARDENLKKNIYYLSMAIDRLAEAVDSSAIETNPLDILLTKDIASAEIHQIRKNRLNPLSLEENWISFTGSEGNILDEIAHIGTVIVNNPGPIGDRRALKGRGSSPQTIQQRRQHQHHHRHHSPYQISHQHAMNTFPVKNHENHLYHNHKQQQLQVMPLGSVPRGRPIPSNSFPVVVITGRNCVSPTPKTCIIGDVDGDGDGNGGGNGKTSVELCRPWGITCDREGHVIIADRSNNRIQIFKDDGTFVRRFGTYGTRPGQFDRPAGVAVDGRRRIIVADKDNHRIQILTMEGIFLLAFGERGDRNGQFNYPWDVAVNTECQIVVSDTRNHRIQLFSAEGIFLRKYGFETTRMWKHFDSPRGIAFNPEGYVVTTDFNNHRIIVIDSDFANARILGSDSSSRKKQFLRPQGLVIDDEGNIIISDSRNHKIQVLDSTGKLRWKFGSYGKGPDEMDRPSGIALTPGGRIAVVDFGNDRVLIY